MRDAGRRVRRLAHGRGRDARAGRARVPAAAAVERRLEDRRSAARSTRVLCREDGGVLDDLFTYRLGDDRYLTVTNAANHEQRPRVAARARRGLRRRGPSTASTTTRCSPCRGRRRASRRAALAEGELPARFRTAELTRRRRGRARLRHRLHGRGRRRAACRRPTAPTRCGTRSSPRASRPPASARATRCGSRPASTSTATTSRGARPDRGGARLVLQGGHGLHRLRGVAAVRAAGPAETLVPFAFTGPGIPRPGQPGRRRRRRGHERHALAVPRARDRDGVRARRRAAPGTTIEIDVRGKRAGGDQGQAALQKGGR